MQEVSLVVATFLTSILSGALGMGGGMLLFALMVQFMTPLQAVPIHAVVQIAANGSRALLLLPNIRWHIVAQFAAGAAVGAAVGSQVLAEPPDGWYQLALAAIILYLTFGPKPVLKKTAPWQWPLVGAVATFLSLFIGATGPLVAPFYLREGLDKLTLIATKAAAQITGHSVKLVAFFFAGFSLSGSERLLLLMCVAAILGSYISKLLLERLPSLWFFRIYRVLIVLLCIRLIIVAFL